MKRIQTVSRLSTAIRKAQGGPFLRIAGCYVVPADGEGPFESLDQIDLMKPTPGRGAAIPATVTLRHFDRLGNANHATPARREHHRPYVFDQNDPARIEAARGRREQGSDR